jgi:AGZA family xanthine/uracil permease-like MFS transporter
MFLTFIGLKNAGMIVADPVTFVKFGKIDFTVFLSIVGILSITVLQRKKNPFSFLVVIAGITLVAFMTGRVVAPTQWLSQPDFESVFFKLDPISALKWSLVPAIFSLMMTDLFDSISTFVGVSQAGGLLDKNGEPKNLKQGLIVDAWATLTAGLFGTSSGTAYIESASGIEAGGRTGLTSVFTALCFLPCFFIGPLVSMVPAYATAPVLIFVGALLFKTVFELKTQKPEDLIPVFLTVTLIPLSFSITQGILWGFISHIILYTFYGRHKELSKTMITIGIMSAIMIWIENT